jgi:hypothetical protein
MKCGISGNHSQTGKNCYVRMWYTSAARSTAVQATEVPSPGKQSLLSRFHRTAQIRYPDLRLPALRRQLQPLQRNQRRGVAPNKATALPVVPHSNIPSVHSRRESELVRFQALRSPISPSKGVLRNRPVIPQTQMLPQAGMWSQLAAQVSTQRTTSARTQNLAGQVVSLDTVLQRHLRRFMRSLG